MKELKSSLCSTMPWAVILILSLCAGAGRTQGPETELSYSIIEEISVNSHVANVREDSRIDQRYDSSILDRLKFRFLAQPSIEVRITETTGIIKTSGRIDRDILCPNRNLCNSVLDVVALTDSPMTFIEIIKVTVHIMDINDNQPVFPEKVISHQLLESAAPGNSFVIPTAMDPDSRQLGVHAYHLDPEDGIFSLQVEEKVDGSTDVKIVLHARLDRERQHLYEVRVIALDGGDPPKSGYMDIKIHVQDVNDNGPVFLNNTYEVSMLENVPVRTTIIQLQARDQDSGLYGEIIYGFSTRTENAYGHLFGIGNSTGKIYTKDIIDYEQGHIYRLVVDAKDRGPDSIPADATVIVNVVDVNDNAPQITVNTLAATGTDSAEIAEDAEIGTFVAHILVSDPDSGRNGRFSCTLNDNHFQLQQLYEQEYKVATVVQLDRESRSRYNLALTCQDEGREPQVSIKHIDVIVLDVNDNDPVFSKPKYEANVTENNYVGAFIVRVNASDLDENENGRIEYQLDKSVEFTFHIDSNSGTITARAIFDREQHAQYKFNVIAVDHGSPPRSGSALVTVHIGDVNDERPRFSQRAYSFGVYENEPPGTEVGTVNAQDKDGEPYNSFVFSLAPSNSMVANFHIDGHSGRITTTVMLDRETHAVYYLQVVASDTGAPHISSTATVSVYVADKNDHAPFFEFPNEINNTILISNKVPVGYVVTRVQAFDSDINGNGNLTYHIQKGNELRFFHIEVNFGVVIVSKEMVHLDYLLTELTILAKDQGEPPKTALTNLNIIVNKSVAFLPPVTEPTSTGPILTGPNFVIVVSLGCVSGLIMVILIIAIVCIRRQEHQRKQHKYNCRMEALKVIQKEKEKELELADQCKPLSNGHCPSSPDIHPCRPHKKEVSFSLDDTHKCARSWPATIDSTIQNSQAHGSVPTQRLSGASLPVAAPSAAVNAPRQHHPPPPSRSGPVSPPRLPHTHAQLHTVHPQTSDTRQAWASPNRELEVQQLLEMLKADVDNDSAYSGEGSNTDSGRGPSEEGDKSLQAANAHYGASMPLTATTIREVQGESPNTSAQPSNRSLSQTSPPADLSLAQVVPNLSFASTHSYSSQPAKELQTFGSRSPHTTLDRQKSPSSAGRSVHRAVSDFDPDTLNRGFIGHDTTNPPSYSACVQQSPSVHCTPFRQGLPLKQKPPYDNWKPGQYLPGLGPHQRGLHQDIDDATTVASEATEDYSVQFSCADISEALHMRNSHQGAGRDARRVTLDSLPDDDAATTTTSGSYVVDPTDLCNEIDDLFFKDMVV